MFQNFDSARNYVDAHHIQMIDLKFTDLWGRLHHLTLPASQFTPTLMKAGIGFDGSSVGLRSVKAGDMVLVPDLNTGIIDPFWEIPTLSFLCTTLEADTHIIFENDPRNIVIKAERYLQSTGIADVSMWGPEFEFYIFDEVAYECSVNRSGYRLESSEADWNSSQGGHGHYIPLHGGYHAIPPKDQLYNLRSEITMQLEGIGIPIKYHHHEVGGPGQCEIETPMMDLVQAGDATMLIKYVTKMAARARGKTATFMPKPLFGEAGFGPFEADIFSWSDEQRAGIKKLPNSLNEALIALENDYEFLLVGEIFTEEMIQQWVDYKRDVEYFPVRNRPHPYEMSLYFDV